jgi:ribosomal protein S18 acetylase RimI-like enzyme
MVFEVVFFPCSDYYKIDPNIIKIVEQDKDVIRVSDTYTGKFPNKSKKSLNPYNIEEIDGKFVVKVPSKTFTDSEWYWIKRLKKLTRNIQQTEETLRVMGLWPVFDIQKGEPIEEVIWNSDNLKNNIDENTGEECGFMAFLIDKTVHKLAGIAKGNIIHPRDEAGDFPKDNPKIPLDREYVYISNVDIHPSYRGKGLCKPFLKEFMDKFTELPEKYTSFYIENASDTGEGIPACLCYVKAGQEQGYEVFYVIRHKNIVEVMSKDECFFSPENPFDLPRSYFYIKPSMEGGKKKKTKRKRNKKTTSKKIGKNKKSKKKM